MAPPITGTGAARAPAAGTVAPTSAVSTAAPSATESPTEPTPDPTAIVEGVQSAPPSSTGAQLSASMLIDQPDAAIARLQAAGINVLGGVEVYNRIEQ